MSILVYAKRVIQSQQNHQKFLRLVRTIFVFRFMVKLPGEHSVTNKIHLIKWIIQLLILNNLNSNVSLLKVYCSQNDKITYGHNWK